jgi:hypothetical protein
MMYLTRYYVQETCHADMDLLVLYKRIFISLLPISHTFLTFHYTRHMTCYSLNI